MLKSHPPVARNVTLFGGKVFKEVTEGGSLSGALIQYDWVSV